MGEMSLDNLSSQYFDVLKELGNIGAGNATTALAQMIGTKVDMSVPQVRLLDFKDVGDMMGGIDEETSAGRKPCDACDGQADGGGDAHPPASRRFVTVVFAGPEAKVYITDEKYQEHNAFNTAYTIV